jgi:hypothetical protein
MQNVDDLAVGFAVLVEKVGDDLSTCCGVCYCKSTGCLIDGVSDATGRKGARMSSKDVKAFIQNMSLLLHNEAASWIMWKGRPSN